MNNASQTPRPYREWRTDPVDREEDAAHTFGFYAMRHCRAEALAKQPDAVKAVDKALHNLFALLEGLWPTEAGADNPVEFVLSVRVRDRQTDQVVEEVEISPAKLDLPVGYWGWVEEQYANPPIGT